MTLSAVRPSGFSAARRAAPPVPEGLAALDARAHAVIAALRCIAAGLADCPTVARLVDDGLGCPRGEGLARVFVFARILAHEARRPLAVGWPGCRALTGLERALAAALAPGGDVDVLQDVLRSRPGRALHLAFTSLRSAPTAM
jgi:hypothetical protein